MRIESHSHATRDRKESSPFTFLPTAILTVGALPFLAQNASAADERTEATPAEGAFIRAESTVGAAFVNLAELGPKKAPDAESVKHFEDASPVITDSGLRRREIKALPFLQAHLKRAKELSSSTSANATTEAAN
jgi:hypothetical protein